MNILEEKQKPLDIFCLASNMMNKSVEHTLGPNGTNTAIPNKKGYFDIINDGKTILESLDSPDPAIATALNTLKQASFETNRKAGDGTTSTTILMNALLQGAKAYIESNDDTNVCIELSKKLIELRDKALSELDNITIPVSKELYFNIAKIALGSDKYAKDLADVFDFLGKNKRPTLIKKDIPNVQFNKIEGISLNKINIVSNIFLESKEFNNVNVLCIYSEVNRFQEITQLLRKIRTTDKPTILFYNKLSIDILENILFNFSNNALNVIPVDLSNYGKGTYSIMCELSDYCDCTVIDGIKHKISDINNIKFGEFDYSVINSKQIILKNNLDKNDKSYLHLEKNSVIIYSGGTNILEQEEVYRRLEDAINSLGNAIDFGIVPGAGTTYSTIIDHLYNMDPDIPKFIIKAMKKIKNILNNIDLDTVYDSKTVVQEVINNAFTLVSQIITTNIIIHDNIR